MTTSEAGIAFIKSCEGFSAYPYNDNGRTAWGYGHDQLSGEEIPESVSRDQAAAILYLDLETRIEPTVNALVPETCTQGQFDALADFAYNLGCGSLRTMLAHGWNSVQAQLPLWSHVNHVENAGLTARRQGELKMFQS